MKEKIHPEFYPEAQVNCACGNTWTVGSTVPVIRTDICSACHPFFTGEQRIVDSGGQVERFMKKLERRDRMIAERQREEELTTSPELSLVELDISSRAYKVLASAGITRGGVVLTKREDGDNPLTTLSGFGLKSLATLKKRLRGQGFILPGDAAPEEAEDAEEPVAAQAAD